MFLYLTRSKRQTPCTEDNVHNELVICPRTTRDKAHFIANLQKGLLTKIGTLTDMSKHSGLLQYTFVNQAFIHHISLIYINYTVLKSRFTILIPTLVTGK